VPTAPGTGGSTPVRTAAPTSGARAAVPSRDELVQAWGDGLLAALPSRARARFRVGRFVEGEEGTAVFALPNETHRSYCEEVRLDVEVALGSHFGTAVPVKLVVDEEDGDTAAGTMRPGETESAPEPDPAPTPPPAAAPRVKAAAPSPAPPTAPPPPSAGARSGGRSAATVAVAAPATVDDEHDFLDPDVLAAETEPAGVGLTPEERLKQAFPGAHEV
jgi:hypothetical protein